MLATNSVKRERCKMSKWHLFPVCVTCRLFCHFSSFVVDAGIGIPFSSLLSPLLCFVVHLSPNKQLKFRFSKLLLWTERLTHARLSRIPFGLLHLTQTHTQKHHSALGDANALSAACWVVATVAAHTVKNKSNISQTNKMQIVFAK